MTPWWTATTTGTRSSSLIIHYQTMTSSVLPSRNQTSSSCRQVRTTPSIGSAGLSTNSIKITVWVRDGKTDHAHYPHTMEYAVERTQHLADDWKTIFYTRSNEYTGPRSDSNVSFTTTVLFQSNETVREADHTT